MLLLMLYQACMFPPIQGLLKGEKTDQLLFLDTGPRIQVDETHLLLMGVIGEGTPYL